MKKLTLIIISMFLVSLFSIHAFNIPDQCKEFNESSGNLLDYSNGVQATVTNAVQNVTAVFDKAYSFDGDNDYSTLVSNDLNTQFGLDAFAVEMLIKIDDVTAGNENIWSTYYGVDEAGVDIRKNNEGGSKGCLALWIYDSGVQRILAGDIGCMDSGVYYHSVVTCNDTSLGRGCAIYLNGTLIKAGDLNYNANSTSTLRFGARATSGTTQELAGDIEFIRSWKGVYINQTGVDLLYNHGNFNPCHNITNIGISSPPALNPALTINHNLVSQANVSDTSLTITFNGSITDTTDLFNCTVNQTDETFDFPSVNLTVLQSMVYNFTGEKTYNFSIYCENDDISDVVGPYTYKVDVVNPLISTTYTDNSLLWKDTSYTYNFTCTDTNLYGHQINVSDVNYTYLDLTGTSHTVGINFTTTSEGNFTVTQECWDSHTLNLIAEKIDVIKENELIFKNVRIISDKSFDYKVEYDKISFTLDKTATSFCYETNGEWDKIENSKYPNHYVDFKNKVWVDDYDNELFINGSKLCTKQIKSLNVKSIGALNYASASYTYEVLDKTDYYLAQTLSNTNEILEVLKMIPIAILWIATTFGGLWLLWKGLTIAGTIAYFFSITFDVMLNLYYINNNVANMTATGLTGFFAWFLMIFLVLWIFLKISIGYYVKERA